MSTQPSQFSYFFENIRAVEVNVTDTLIVPITSTTDNSTKAASTSFVQSLVTNASNNLLETDNTWSGTNTFDNVVTVDGTLAVFNNPVNIATPTVGEALLNIQCTTGPTNSGVNLTNIGITQSGNVINYLRETIVTANKGTSNTPIIAVQDGTSTAELFIVPSSAAGFNPIVATNDTVLGCQHSNGSESVLDICVSSSQVSGIKVTPNSTYLYGGGSSTANPAASLALTNNTLKVYPSLTFPDNSVQTTAFSGLSSSALYNISNYWTYYSPTNTNYYYWYFANGLGTTPYDGTWSVLYWNTSNNTSSLTTITDDIVDQVPDPPAYNPYPPTFTSSSGGNNPPYNASPFSWPSNFPRMTTFIFQTCNFNGNIVLPWAQEVASIEPFWTFVNYSANNIYIYCQEPQFQVFQNSSGATDKLLLAPNNSLILGASRSVGWPWSGAPTTQNSGACWFGISFYAAP
ncbi:hypothetical protein EBZ38_06780 [bacterium]|nr:hypothetical protein [bacterium]